MRVLLIAYEFPPVLSAQALRWYYLANELGKLGVEIDILTPVLRDIWNFNPDIHSRVTVHRCFAGPFITLSGWISAYRDRTASVGRADEPAAGRFDRGLERTYRFIRYTLDGVLFPDVRTEWFPFAWRKARKLHADRRYVLVITSHEPGVDLLLGLKAQRHWNLPWIVDLGDPVLTPYTPQWRKRFDLRFERLVCQRADEILITADGVKKLLCDRHCIPQRRISLIFQGFDRSHGSELKDGLDLPTDRLVIVFTGSFYKGFRDPTKLIAALRRFPNLIMIIVGNAGVFERAFRTLDERVIVLGKRPHGECLTLQRRADVLLSLGNVQNYQVPGKVYEYLGADRPILHITNAQSDPIPELLLKTKRGLVVANKVDTIADAIEALERRWREGVLDCYFDLREKAVTAYSWASQGKRLFRIVDKYMTP